MANSQEDKTSTMAILASPPSAPGSTATQPSSILQGFYKRTLFNISTMPGEITQKLSSSLMDVGKNLKMAMAEATRPPLQDTSKGKNNSSFTNATFKGLKRWDRGKSGRDTVKDTPPPPPSNTLRRKPKGIFEMRTKPPDKRSHGPYEESNTSTTALFGDTALSIPGSTPSFVTSLKSIVSEVFFTPRTSKTTDTSDTSNNNNNSIASDTPEKSDNNSNGIASDTPEKSNNHNSIAADTPEKSTNTPDMIPSIVVSDVDGLCEEAEDVLDVYRSRRPWVAHGGNYDRSAPRKLYIVGDISVPLDSESARNFLRSQGRASDANFLQVPGAE